MRFGLSILAALVLVGAIILMSRPAPAAPDQIIIDRVHVIDVESGAIARDRALVLEAGILTAIEPAGLAAPSGVRRIDGAGRYVTPGLWDSHVHALGDVEDALDRVLPLFVAYGVTHVRDMGSNLDRLETIRTALAADPDRIAPHILASGPLLMEQELRWYGDIQLAIGEPGAAEAAVDMLSNAGVDFVKAYTGLSAASYQALTAAAAERGLSVDGHVPDSMGLVGVVEAGQRTIEHLDFSAFLTCAGGPDGPFGNHIAVRFNVGMTAYLRMVPEFWAAVDWETCGPALERLGARGGALTPTLSMEIRDRSRVPEAALERLSAGSRAWCLQGLEELDATPSAVREAAYAAVQTALSEVTRHGVTLLAGTDAPNHCIVAGVSLAIELERLREAGLSPLDVLQTATLNPAQVFGVEAGLRVGRPADFILLDVNPLVEPTAYRSVSGVFTQGRWIDQAALSDLRNAGRAQAHGDPDG